MNMRLKQKGFTLVELLIVIAIIAILAAAVFVALDPLTRFRDSRDSRRWSDVANLVNAIKLDQVDNGGNYTSAITALTDDTYYLIGTDASGCNGYNGNCDVTIANTGNCVDLTSGADDLVTEGYIVSIPISPNGAGTWTAGHSGYYLYKASTGIVTIGACESENTDAIAASK